jgi:hypothetical protein
MNIDTLVESFYTKRDETETLINEVLALFLETEKPVARTLVEARRQGFVLTWDGIPDIPISEIPWSDVKTVEGEGADIQGPQRMQLMQFLNKIEGDDLKDKIDGLATFYDADPQALLDLSKDMKPKEAISAALGYLTFFKTLTKIIAHFNASSAGFSFEAFMGVLLGGVQISTGEGTIADLTAMVGGIKVPISLKLYTDGSLKVGGSFTDLVNDIRKYGQMQYVAVTKDLDDEKQSGTLNFYRFNFTLDNIGTILLNAGIHNPDLMRLPQGFIDSKGQGFEDIEIPAPPKVEELEKLYRDRVAELGAKANPPIPPDVLSKALEIVGLPEDTSFLNTSFGQTFGRDKLTAMTPNAGSAKTINLAYKLGVLPEEAVESLMTPEGKLKKPKVAWVSTYEDNILLAAQIYNGVVKAAYDSVVDETTRNIRARQELIKRAGGVYDTRGQGDDKTKGIEGEARATESVIAYNKLSPEMKKKALLLTHGYVNRDQFDLTESRVKDIAILATKKPGAAPDQETAEAPITDTEAQDAASVGVFPAGQNQIKLGSLEVGQEKVIGLLERVSEIIDASVFQIFEDLKALTTNIQAYFGNGLQDEENLILGKDGAIAQADSIGTKTGELTDKKEK